jgi:uncharacterized protein
MSSQAQPDSQRTAPLFVLFYESGPEVAAKAPVHFPAHKVRLDEFRDRGELLLVGPFGDGSGSMAVFRTRQRAEEFAAGDPFVLNGVVTASWHIREWNEAFGIAPALRR